MNYLKSYWNFNKVIFRTTQFYFFYSNFSKNKKILYSRYILHFTLEIKIIFLYFIKKIYKYNKEFN